MKNVNVFQDESKEQAEVGQLPYFLAPCVAIKSFKDTPDILGAISGNNKNESSILTRIL